jgi:exo-beta-1,3-glucanase (GH17 family)
MLPVVARRRGRGLRIVPGSGLFARSAVTITACAVLALAGCSHSSHGSQAPATSKAPPPATAPRTWADIVSGIRWVDYSPTLADPNKGIEPTVPSMRADLALLRRTGFTGLITYGSSGAQGKYLPRLARDAGFKGLILGIWNPSDGQEIKQAEAAASLPIVLGYCVGNEGLHERYQLDTLSSAIKSVRRATGKPVTTTEEIDDYASDGLLGLGDWVFPNAHPYFHGQKEPEAAVRWTQSAWDDMARRSGRFVFFKEVGLPTDGDPQGTSSEEGQSTYYTLLGKTSVKFAYFEAFDQPWKNQLPVEPHWGLFRSDRTPKLFARTLLQQHAPVPSPSPGTAGPTPVAVTTASASETATSGKPVFFIYADAGATSNHFTPSGYMGDIGDIGIDDAYTAVAHSGTTSIRVTYTAKGSSPNDCPYAPPCKWAGVYWQEPPNNWGTDAALANRGYDLTGYRSLLFWARADKPTSIEFQVGGIDNQYGDSLNPAQAITARLGPQWQEYRIDLGGADLSHIIGGFAWVTNWDANPNGCTFYLDDIRFE